MRIAQAITRGRTCNRAAIFSLTLLVAAAATPSHRVQAAGNDPGTSGNSAETELIDVFGDLCLNRFPNEAAFAQGGKGRHLEPMPAEGVKEFLHDDPGRGWFGKTSSGVYVVTIESPPYLACAVRRVQKPSPALQSTFHAIIGNWAAIHKSPTVLNFPPMHQVKGDMTINVTAEGIAGPDGKPQQTFMAFVTDYKSGQTEVRLVRQFAPK